MFLLYEYIFDFLIIKIPMVEIESQTLKRRILKFANISVVSQAVIYSQLVVKMVIMRAYLILQALDSNFLTKFLEQKNKN